MSFKAKSRTRFVTATTLLLVAAAGLGACGFKPLYGQNNLQDGASAQAQTQLATVTIEHISDRVGQMMRTELKRRLAPRGQKADNYRLHVTISESLSALAVEQNAFATRANLALTANYRLVRVSDGFELTAATPRQVASYNILTSDYATLSAQEDARERAVKALADTIHTRLAIYFEGPGKVVAKPQTPTNPYSIR